MVFLDADVEVTPGWLAPLLAHFADPAVAAIAPRVRARAADGSTLDRFERHCSPLDMGPLPSIVSPRQRVRYVPSAALLFRRDVLDALDGTGRPHARSRP
ncbi:MAG: glycosyltransferase [bacterium]|nr:glycosyltransferase [bacterium]